MVKLKTLLDLIQSLSMPCEAYLSLVPFMRRPEDYRYFLLSTQMRDERPSYDKFRSVYNEAEEYDAVIYEGHHHEDFPPKDELTEALENHGAQEDSVTPWAPSDGSITEKAVYLYPFRATNNGSPDELFIALLVDAVFYAIDQAKSFREEHGSPAFIRDLIGKYYAIHKNAYDPVFFPIQNSWAYREIKNGKVFKDFTKSRDKTHRNLNPIGKEIEFVNILTAKLKEAVDNDASNAMLLYFLLYMMNKGSHSFDSILSAYYHKNYSLHPWMFSTLYPLYLERQDAQTVSAFYNAREVICNLWSTHLSQQLYFESTKDIVALLDEIGQTAYVQGFIQNTGMVSLIEQPWQTIQREWSLEDGMSLDYDYYRLMANQAKRSRLTANGGSFNDEVLQQLSEKIDKNAKQRASCFDEDGAEYTDEDRFEKDTRKLLKDHINSRDSYIGEAEWRRNEGVPDSELGRNPILDMKFPKSAEEAKFGCPLRIFQKNIDEIEDILGEAVILTASEHLLIDSDTALEDCADEIKEEIANNRESLLKQISRLHKSLSGVPRAFYELLMQYDLYPALINLKTKDGRGASAGIIPSKLERSKDNPSEMVWKIDPSAKQEDQLQYVYRQSPKWWLSLLETLCGVSFGKKALANTQEEFRCFRTECKTRQGERCRTALIEILKK